MESNAQHPVTNRFFFKFYNYNVEDAAVIDLVPNDLYTYVMREQAFYMQNAELSHMDSMQFNSFLFNLVKLNFEAAHERLVADIQKIVK